MSTDQSIYKDLSEYLSSRFEKDEAIEMVHESQLYDVMMDMALSNDKTLGWRATWILANCMDKGTDWLIPRLPEVIQALHTITKDGHIRELLKFFRDIDFKDYPEEHQSELFDLCLDILKNNKIQAGTRSNALQIMLKFAEVEPFLIGEIRAAYEMVKTYLSGGIRHSCEKRINRLELEIINQE